MASVLSASSLTDVLVILLVSAVILTLTYLVAFGFNKVVMRAIGRRSRSSAYEIGRIGSIVIWGIGVLSILPVFGASDIVIAVIVLLVGAFLILSTRDFTSNWFAGQMIRAIAPFKVGDWIRTPDGSYGRVTKMDGLYTLLITPQNETIVIPNSKLTSDLILDRTTSGSFRVPIDLELNRDIEFAQLTSAVAEVTKGLAQYLYESGQRENEPEIHVVSTTLDSVKVRVFLEIGNAAREEEVASEFLKGFNRLMLERPKARVAD